MMEINKVGVIHFKQYDIKRRNKKSRHMIDVVKVIDKQKFFLNLEQKFDGYHLVTLYYTYQDNTGGSTETNNKVLFKEKSVDADKLFVDLVNHLEEYTYKDHWGIWRFHYEKYTNKQEETT